MQHPLAYPAGLYPAGGGSAALRGVGAAVRTSQIMGIEWLDYAKQSYDDASSTIERLAAAATPAEAWAIQGAFLRTAAERFAARSTVLGDLFATFTADLVRMPGATEARPPA
jgi:hypothetical protein